MLGGLLARLLFPCLGDQAMCGVRFIFDFFVGVLKRVFLKIS